MFGSSAAGLPNKTEGTQSVDMVGLFHSKTRWSMRQSNSRRAGGSRMRGHSMTIRPP